MSKKQFTRILSDTDQARFVMSRSEAWHMRQRLHETDGEYRLQQERLKPMHCGVLQHRRWTNIGISHGR